MTVDPDDWRLSYPREELVGVDLQFRKYVVDPRNPSWDHDHCEFCGAKIMAGPDLNILHEGYSTLDAYTWICPQCFGDLRERFGWTVVSVTSR